MTQVEVSGTAEEKARFLSNRTAALGNLEALASNTALGDKSRKKILEARQEVLEVTWGDTIP